MNGRTINDDLTMAEAEGTLLSGRYRIVRPLGRGGMGSVWLAGDTQLDGKLFAIKMLPSVLVTNRRAYRQLKDEALVAMKLTHPNIVTLRAFEENDGNPFLVMDYIDGQTLDDYLAEAGNGEREAGNGRARTPGAPQPGGLPEEEVVRILTPIAAALDYAHRQGVVHRDVKPGNVMVRKDGCPFILDFGIAREIQETMTRVTGKLSSGTLLYMSPEQLNGEKPTSAQDIYSFAAMAYECLKGEPPFTRGAIEDQIKNKAPEPLPNSSSKTGGMAEGRGSMTISDSVMAGLAKQPGGRPSTCMDVLGLGVGSTAGCGRSESFAMAAVPGIEELMECGGGDEPVSEEDKRCVEALCAKLRKRDSLPAWLDEGALGDLSQLAVAGVVNRLAREWMRESCRRGLKRYVPLFTRNDWSRWSVRARNGEIASKTGMAIYEFVRDDDFLSRAW